MDFLPTLWFVAIAALWIGYLLLEGFDLGVGMLMLTSTRDEKQRRLMLNTIGPVWDGNEVWLITAGAATFAALSLWLTRKGTVPRSKFLMGTALLSIAAPFGANIAGWVFTEMGRQPFVVAPNPTPGGVDGVYMFTAAAVSPGVTGEEIVFSLIAFALVYGVMLALELRLLVRYVRGGVASAMPELAHPADPLDTDDPDKRDDVLAFAY